LVALTFLSVLAAIPGSAAAQCPPNQEDAIALVNEGDAERNVNIDGAISKYEQAAKLDDSAPIWWKLALAYERKQDWSKMAGACAKAEKAAERADKKRTHADYYFREGFALEQLAEHGDGPWKDAEGPFRTSIQLDPNYAQAYGELAWVLLHLDDEPGALQNWTKAIAIQPDDTQLYVSLADEYRRLMYSDQEEQVLKQGISFAKEGDKHLFNLHLLLADAYETKRNIEGAVSEYELAKKACDANRCADHKEAYFYLGAAYTELNPPRKSDAMQLLTSFWKMSGGAQAQKYADMRAQAQELARRIGGSLQ
jgi:tetratricopeptide (TPR) repeat protein